MKTCRDCEHPVSPDAYLCPKCGAPKPADPTWDGWGFEYRSNSEIQGWPLLHISFKYKNFRPVPAKGIIAIGQFAIGVVTISQFGAGIFSLGQFALSLYAVAQFAVAYSAIAQIGLVWAKGYGQLIYFIQELLEFM